MAYFFLFVVAHLPYLTQGVTRKIIVIAIMAAMTLIGGLRFESGYDWYVYEKLFDEIDIAGGILSNISGNLFEPGYVTLTYVVKYFGGSIQLVYFAAALFHSVCLLKLMSSQRTNNGIVLMLFIGFCFLLQYMALLRFSIASAFIYLGIVYLLRARFFRFYFFVACASLFHIFALFMIPFGYLIRCKPQLSTVLIASIISISAVFILNSSSILFLIDLIQIVTGVDKYSAYSPSPEARPSTSSIAFFILNFCYCIFVVNLAAKHQISSGTIKLSFWLSIATMAAILIAFPIPSIWNRVMCISIVVQGMALAAIAGQVRIQSKRLIMLMCSCFAAVILFYTTVIQDTWFTPYQSLVQHWLGYSTNINRERMEDYFSE